jgi:hypothetical protein
VHDSVDVPDPPLTLVGATLHRRSVEFVVSEIETEPTNPFCAAMVIVDWPLVPVVTEILAGLVAIEKS